MANSADSEEAIWSRSTLFAKAEYIRAQQHKGKYIFNVSLIELGILNANWLSDLKILTGSTIKYSEGSSMRSDYQILRFYW